MVMMEDEEMMPTGNSLSDEEREEEEEEEDWADTSWAEPKLPGHQMSPHPPTSLKSTPAPLDANRGVAVAADGGSGAAIVGRMELNDNKAGMQGLDKERINQIIYEASKGSKFYENERKKEEQMQKRIEEQRLKTERLTEAQLQQGQLEADKLLDDLEKSRDLSHTIVHIDMDAFYAAVEMRDRPELKDKPMAVGGNSMLSTSNYHARKYGVRAAMPGFIGRKLCPDLIIVPTNFDKYTSVSKHVRSIMADYDPEFCPMSLDEAYLDLSDHLDKRRTIPVVDRTYLCRDRQFVDSKDHCLCDLNLVLRHLVLAGKVAGEQVTQVPESQLSDIDPACLLTSLDCNHNVQLHGTSLEQCPQCGRLFPPYEVVTFDLEVEDAVKELRSRIEQRTRLTASAGIAPNMMLSKVCSDLNKPNGQYRIEPSRDAVLEFIKNLSTRKISGIGKVSEAMLTALGVRTCTDLHTQRALLYHLFSPISFNYFMRISLGIGSTTVKSDSERKSMSTERTFQELNRPADLYRKCEELCDALADDLSAEKLKGKTVGVKIKTVKFEVKTKAQSLSVHTSDRDVILKAATDLLRAEIQACSPHPLRLRLMGVRLSGLVSDTSCQNGGQNTITGLIRRMVETSGRDGETTVGKVNRTDLSALELQKISDTARRSDQCTEDTLHGHLAPGVVQDGTSPSSKGVRGEVGSVTNLDWGISKEPDNKCQIFAGQGQTFTKNPQSPDCDVHVEPVSPTPVSESGGFSSLSSMSLSETHQEGNVGTPTMQTNKNISLKDLQLECNKDKIDSCGSGCTSVYPPRGSTEEDLQPSDSENTMTNFPISDHTHTSIDPKNCTEIEIFERKGHAEQSIVLEGNGCLVHVKDCNETSSSSSAVDRDGRGVNSSNGLPSWKKCDRQQTDGCIEQRRVEEADTGCMLNSSESSSVRNLETAVPVSFSWNSQRNVQVGSGTEASSHSSSSSSSQFVCPVCGQQTYCINLTGFNQHIDRCLGVTGQPLSNSSKKKEVNPILRLFSRKTDGTEKQTQQSDINPDSSDLLQSEVFRNNRNTCISNTLKAASDSSSKRKAALFRNGDKMLSVEKATYKAATGSVGVSDSRESVTNAAGSKVNDSSYDGNKDKEMPAGGRDTGTASRDTVAGGRDTGTASRDTVAGGRDTGTASRDTVAGGRDTGTASRDTVAGGRDTGTASRDTVAGGRDTGTASRDTAAVSRDTGTASRDTTAGGRDTGTASRDTTAGCRDTGTASRDTTAGCRDTGTASRDTTAVGRDTGTANRDTTAAGRDTGTGGSGGSLLVCPVCSQEQRVSTLDAFNSHVDVCLSKGAISEILRKQQNGSEDSVKRPGVAMTPSRQPPAKRKKLTSPKVVGIQPRSITAFFKEK